jgi:undecaprenyl diphosphate synthase
LPSTLRALVDRLTSRASPDSERLVLVVALAYGGRQEIVATASQLAAQVARGALKADAIDELLFSETLRMRGAGLGTTMSDPDLLLRTGGHRRLSNFMLFQCAYTELHTVDVLWPDFSEHDLVGVLKEYSGRRRTFGVRESPKAAATKRDSEFEINSA